MTDKHENEDLSGLSPNDADRKGAGTGSGAEPSEDAGAGYGNHAQPDADPDAGLDGEPGDASLDGE